MQIRTIKKADIPTVHKMLHDFAVYQNVESLFQSSVEELETLLCAKNPVAMAYVGVLNGKIIAFSCLNLISSTFYGGKGILIEDLYIVKEHRAKGFGKQFLSYIAQIASDKNCKFMQWEAYKSNPKAIKFYESLGAEGSDMVLFLISGENLRKLGCSK